MAKYLHGRRQISGWPILPELGHNLTSGQKQKAAKMVTVEKTEKTKRSNMETVENMKKGAKWRYCSESSGKMESMASPKPARFPIETNPGFFLSNLEDLNQVRSLVWEIKPVKYCNSRRSPVDFVQTNQKSIPQIRLSMLTWNLQKHPLEKYPPT